MEKKTTRRLIGVLVVVALAIILLPLMFNSNDAQAPVQTAEVSSQPLPDTIADTLKASDTTTLAENVPAPISNIQTVDPETIQAAPEPVKEVVAKKVEPVISHQKAKTVVAAKKVKPTTVAANTTPQTNDDFIIASNGEAAPTTIEKPVPEKTKTVATKKDRNIKDRNTAETMAAANQGGWVVQLGSFRSLTNVNKLMARLNEKGYHAFTFATKSNGQTRVYVGPAFKREAANELLNKIQHDVNIRGVVLTYNPTTA